MPVTTRNKSQENQLKKREIKAKSKEIKENKSTNK